MTAFTDEQVLAYLSRIGMARPPVLDAPGLDAAVLDAAVLNATVLAELQQAHLLTVPFENLSVHLGEAVSLEPADLIAKIVGRRRGGFCYELNGAFALLLEALGAKVSRVAARVYGPGGLGPPFDHLALVVELPDGSGPWLADVGFGAHSTYPLRFGRRDMQHDPAAEFRLADAADGDVEVLKDGAPQYRIEPRSRALADFAATCWYQQTSPDSHFTQGSICSLLTPDGRVSIAGRTLIRTTGSGRDEQQLTSDEAVLAAYRDNFGISLDRIPAR